jgi:2-succinyl-5-enolpyruvyl-6-hydroxy-3-cyclohexene-1-carboxylate synthase
MDVGLHNEKTTAFLIDQLIAHGVKRFCLSPGSRSTALALAVAKAAHKHPHIRCDTHYDERGLGFYALGFAKGSKEPVALIVTSGTAVGNLLPAVMEASNDHVPLLLLTADRPEELQDCSANQTVDQVKLFSSYLRWQANLPLSDPLLPPRFLAAALGQALYLCQNLRPGPVHLNCMLREPFFSSEEICPEKLSIRGCETGQLVPSAVQIKALASQLSKCKKGLIIAGALPHDVEAEDLLILSEKLGFPIYADILSQLRNVEHPHIITYFDALVQGMWHQDLEAVVHFGGRTVSKNVSEWLKKEAISFYLHIWEHSTLLDPHTIVTHRLQASPMFSAKLLADAVHTAPDPLWLQFWKEGDAKAAAALENYFSEHPEISEPGIIPCIAKACAQSVDLFLANSMLIRDADKFFPAMPSPLRIFGNRGVSGIDGNIATAAGIAQGQKRPLIALIGDLAFLHDMNSLSLLHAPEHPVCLIVVNNGGGGIFSFLPVYAKKEPFEKFFAGAHAYTFSQAAALFQIPYAQPNTISDLDELLNRFVEQKESLFIEISTDRQQNVKVHQDIAACIKQYCEAAILC